MSEFRFTSVPNWPAGQPITWSIVPDTSDFPNASSLMLPPAFVADVRLAFASWAAVADLTFLEVADDPETTDIRFSFADALGGAAIGRARTTFFPTEPVQSNIQFLSSVNFVTTGGDTLPGRTGKEIPFISVALHEIGHALGLDHEDSVPAIMGTVVNVDITTLQPDDIAGIQARYGPAAGAAVQGQASGGDDLVVGQDASGDLLQGLGGNDRMFGLAGNDTLMGGDGNDTISGNRDDDVLDGQAGDDLLRGTFGDDTLTGGAGGDMLFGGAGDDSLDGGDGNDEVNGNAGFDTVFGGAGNDTVRGQGNADVLYGGDGDDRLLGNQGPDTLFGGSGNDMIIGAAGDDEVTGGAGSDIFVFAPQQGTDLITDFENGTDIISLVGVAGFDDVTITAIAGGVRLTFEPVPTTVIELDGVSAGQLDPSDFFFS